MFGFGKKKPVQPMRQSEEFSQEMADEEEREKGFLDRASMASFGEPISDSLEDYLKRSEETAHARILAARKLRTAEARKKAISAENKAVKKLEQVVQSQKLAEEEADEMDELPPKEHWLRGCLVFDTFFSHIDEGKKNAVINNDQERKLLGDNMRVKSPEGIQALLKKFKGKLTGDELLAVFGGDEGLRNYYKQMTDEKSRNPFWGSD